MIPDHYDRTEPLINSSEYVSCSFLVWGSRGHGLVVLDVIRALGADIVALCDNDPNAVSIAPPLPVLCGANGLRAWIDSAERPRDLVAAIAIGGDRGRDRELIATMLASHGIAAPILIHPHASVSPAATLHRGVQVLANAVVASGALIGPLTIINNSANVDHECRLGKAVHIAPGAVLCGCVTVGDYAFVGAGAVVLPRVNIGTGATVGAGATVTKDVLPGDVVIGCPARSHFKRDSADESDNIA